MEAAQPHLLSTIGEFPGSMLVMKKMTGVVGGNEYIGVTVIVIVTDSHSLPVADIYIQAGTSRNVLKGAISFIMKESATGAIFHFGKWFGRPGLNQQNIQPAVIVKVQKGAAGGRVLDIPE